MNNFTFYNPTKVHFGVGMITKLAADLTAAGVHKCLLAAGGGSIKHNGVYADTIAMLETAGIARVEAWGIQANPTLEKVRELIALARTEAVDAILAVGGGSVIDSAKAVAAGFYLDDIWEVFSGKARIERALPIFAVLTISATGSEMNGNSVLTNTATQQKWGMGSELVYPRATVIDPAYQSTLPPKQTVNGALDAIAHILEFYFMDPEASVTMGIDDSLQKTIIAMTDRLLRDPLDTSARANLAWSATLALNGISGAGMKGGDWACHQIEHAFSALHPEISHGEGLGVIFPAWIEFMAERDPKIFDLWAKAVWNEDNTASALKAFRAKIKAWGSATSLRELGIKDNELPRLLDLIMIYPRIGGFSRLNREDVEALLMLAF
ncbi:MAG TPA: iron-containing alcohol dehydrogenase [Candidatus Cloacimonadota bacterium]|nr:iron-containing alcohol dehydrogenase [Candidatus Cloacimonadota bacterium]